MSEQEKQTDQKTIMMFIAGLIIGGLLVWIFVGTGTNDVATDEQDQDALEQQVYEADQVQHDVLQEEVAGETLFDEGVGSVVVSDQAAGMSAVIDGATFPTEEGWIAVRSQVDGNLGMVLGAVRYSKVDGLIPTEIHLLAATTAGSSYAVVFFSEDGDREFNLSKDLQIGDIAGTFTAQ